MDREISQLYPGEKEMFTIFMTVFVCIAII